MNDQATEAGAAPGQAAGVAVETVAKMLLADYDSEFDAGHLTWRDFEPQARRIVEAVAAAAAAQPAASLRTPTDGPAWRDSAEQLAGQLAIERPQRFALIRALATIRDSYDAGTMAHDTAHAALDRLHEPTGQPAPELTRLREQVALLQADIADYEALLARWPRCPAGCSCRIGIDTDPDANECGCDGPCNGGEQPAPGTDAARLRDVVCKLLDLYGAPDNRLMQHSSVTRATLQRYAGEAGVRLDGRQP